MHDQCSTSRQLRGDQPQSMGEPRAASFRECPFPARELTTEAARWAAFGFTGLQRVQPMRARLSRVQGVTIWPSPLLPLAPRGGLL